MSAIGDVTHVIPVIKTIQKTYPEASITWVVGQLEYKLLHGLPGVEFIVFNKRAGWAGIKKMRQQMAGRRFDVLLQMQLSFRANVVSRLIKARRRIGFDKIRAKEGHRWVINEAIAYQKDCHVLDGFMQFAEHLGCEEKVMNWHIPTSDDDKRFAKELLSHGRKNVVISPCSSHQLRNWSVNKYAELVKTLVDVFGVHVILTGSPSPSEKEFVASIVEKADVTVVNLAGKDTLKQLLCLLRGADLVISPDSGPLHMAGSVGTPVIGLLAASNYKRSGSYQYPELTVDKYPEACEKFLGKPVSQLRWGTKTEFPGAMDLIMVSDVIKVVERVLK